LSSVEIFRISGRSCATYFIDGSLSAVITVNYAAPDYKIITNSAVKPLNFYYF